MAPGIKSIKSKAISGNLTVPGDKSISHRALICGAISTGETRIRGLLESEDVLATLDAFRKLGVQIACNGGDYIVTGSGLGGLMKPESPLDFGNSGTGARLMMGVIAGNPISAEFAGDKSLRQRPMARVLDPLRSMGLTVTPDSGNRLPLTLSGTDRLIPIEYELPVPSAQVKSAVLFAGLHASGRTTVIEPVPTRDHTERLLKYFDADIVVTAEGTRRKIEIVGEKDLTGRDISVPGDPSSAAFLTAAALICPESDLSLENILVNPSRIGFYETLIEMGANISFENMRDDSGETVADIRVKYSRLNGVCVPAERAPSMIDEYPCLAVVASLSQGTTTMDGLSELRVKESDRLGAMADGLTSCGVNASVEQDSLVVQGGKVSGGANIDPHLDHRIAMAFLTLGLGAENPVTVNNVATISSSFPNYVPLMKSLGADYREIGNNNIS